MYTLPSSFYGKSDLSEKTELEEFIIERLIAATWEEEWPQTVKAVMEGKNSASVVEKVKGFVITQSVRTPKFLEGFIKRSETLALMGFSSKFSEDDHAGVFGTLMMKVIIDFMPNSVCEVLRSSSLANFITSDNPATHWVTEGNNYRYLDTWPVGEMVWANPNFKIICPIHPKLLVIVTPNAGLNHLVNKPKDLIYRRIFDEQVFFFNKLIEIGADRLLISKNMEDFICLNRPYNERY